MSSVNMKSNATKRRIHEIDDTIEYLTHKVKNLKDNMLKSELECSLMTVKLKREKVNALTAAARSQILLAEMEVLIAETDLVTDIERLKNIKRIKLKHEGNTSQESNKTRATSVKSAHVQTTKPMFDKKNKRKLSFSNKSTVDISADETILIPSINESTPVSKKSATSTSKANGSDSEVSLSNSIKAEFNEPYNKTQVSQYKPSNKKHRSSNKVDAKHCSTNDKPTQLPSNKTKTVADIKRTAGTTANIANTTTVSRPHHSDIISTAAMSSYVPIKHNMPMTVSQPKNNCGMFTSTSGMSNSPYYYFNGPASQAGVYGPSTSAYNHNFTVFGSISKQ